MHTPPVPERRFKSCLHCSMEILQEAKKCKYCKKYLDVSSEALSISIVEPRKINPYISFKKGIREAFVLVLTFLMRIFGGYITLGILSLIIVVIGWICSFFISDYDIPNAKNADIVSYLPASIVPIEYEEQLKDKIWADGILYEDKVKLVGDNLIRKNNIKENIKFRISRDKSEEYIAYSLSKERLIVITNQALSLIHSDDELAVLLGHEIAHIEYNEGSFTHKVLESKDEKTKHFKKEFEADVLGTTIAKNAGYNPIAGITLFKTILSLKEGTELEYRFNSTTATHPPTSARIKVLEYLIHEKYPEYENGKIQSEWSLFDDVLSLKEELDLKNLKLTQQNSELDTLKRKIINQTYQNAGEYENAKAKYNKMVNYYNAEVEEVSHLVDSINTLKMKYDSK